MTTQSLFNRVAKHLLKQNARAVAPGGMCQYKMTKNGVTLKCAVGCLIKPEYYKPSFEGPNDSISDSPSLMKALEKSIGPLKTSQIHMLDKLQELHDGNKPNLWLNKLRKLAAKLELNTKALIVK